MVLCRCLSSFDCTNIWRCDFSLSVRKVITEINHTLINMDQLLGLLGACCPCVPDFSTPYLSINNHKYKIIRLLGEGGFSYVYLVSQKSDSSAYYALKRIRCPFGANDEAFKNAMKEVKNCHRFSNAKTPYIVQSIEESVIQEKDGSRTVCILLPYFEKSLQDIINYNVLNNKTMEESEILRILIGICRGLQVMHKYKRVSRSGNVRGAGAGSGSGANELEEEADLLLPGDSEEEYDDDEDDGMSMGMLNNNSTGGLELEELIPFAHRDIKPANVMISAEGLPVLVDLGSCSKARLFIKTRQQALTVTDFAQAHCTLPYRAPELLDVETNTELTEKTDVWSLGCVIYSCCFGLSPFEKIELEQGANLTVAISSGKYSLPNDTRGYTKQLISIIESCLVIDSNARPSVDDILETALEMTRRS